MIASPRVALVLGGGGLKGFAHVGVLRALTERGIFPTVYAGTSIGALIAAARAGGMEWHEMARRAESLRRRDLFRVNHVGMLVDRLKVPSFYLEEPLRFLCESVAPPGKFHELPVRLLVNTVDLAHGTQVVWGLPGLQDVRVADAVYASCALPGAFPPGVVDGRICVDGGVVDNLPAAIAGIGTDYVIAVDVGSSDLTHEKEIASQGFFSIYMRAATTMMHTLQQQPLTAWQGPPMLLIRPRVSHVGWFDFQHTAEPIDAGYRAAEEAFDHLDTVRTAPGGVFPRRSVRVVVDHGKCTGCGICVALAPNVMGLDSRRKAYALTHVLDWSPADGDFVNHCPTRAISIERVDSRRGLPILEQEAEGEIPGPPDVPPPTGALEVARAMEEQPVNAPPLQPPTPGKKVAS